MAFPTELVCLKPILCTIFPLFHSRHAMRRFFSIGIQSSQEVSIQLLGTFQDGTALQRYCLSQCSRQQPRRENRSRSRGLLQKARAADCSCERNNTRRLAQYL